MAPGTRSSKEGHATKSATSAATTSENANQSHEDTKSMNSKADNKENTTQPLGPPPRPQQGDGADYFSQSHAAANNPAYQAEPNPFEAQFGNSSADVPSKLLPSVAQLTSPSSLLPNDTPGWSLRSGPLSPAMLTGPTGGGGDYFDQQYPRGFPTPNESNMRTGLTPGGGGSMFPAPSPSGMFGGMNMGAPTPNTLDFFKTNANSRANATVPTSNPTSQPLDQVSNSMDLKMPTAQASDNYAQHDADAANGLFMLAQSNGSRPGNQFAMSTSLAGGPVQSTDAMDNVRSSRSQKNSMPSTQIHADDDDDSDISEEVVKPATRSRGKRASEPSKPNNRRKTTDGVTRPNKRQKAAEKEPSMDLDDDDDDDDMPPPKDGKKMTDEEKRKNFLERNRVAALKCRQRKKQWLQNLQTKVDLYSQENDSLTHTVNLMRDYIGQLRGLLLQHKDCPVTLQHPMGQQQLMQFLAQDSMVFMPSANGMNGQQMQMNMMGDVRGQQNGNGMGPNGNGMGRP